jgi:hypothetical protein
MKNVLWQTGMRVIQQVLDWFQSGKELNDTELKQDVFNAGIVTGLLNEFDIIVGTNNTPVTPSITIRTGVAHDINGERIIIDDENISYDATNPADTTNDGKGNLVSTPHSTGSLNVPLTVNTNNYIWIDYLQAADESEFTLQKVTNKKLFYKRTDGYQITVTTVNTPPTANSLKLGNVNLTAFGVVSGATISKANRIYFTTKLKRVQIQTADAGKTDRTLSYPAATSIFLDDHIKAVGTGTVTHLNPHGVGPVDIGLSPANTVQDHQQFFHSSGIIGSPTTTTSSLFGAINVITPGEDQLIVKPLITGEEVHIDGLVILPSDIPTDVIVTFNALDPNGTYYIYLDKNTKTILKTQVDLITTPDITKFLLYTVTWTYPGVGLGDLSDLVNRRVFGVTANRDIQRDLPHFIISLLTDNYPITSSITYSPTAYNTLTSSFSGTDLRGIAFSYSASYTYTPSNDDVAAVLTTSTETFIYGTLTRTTTSTYTYDGNNNLISVTRV